MESGYCAALGNLLNLTILPVLTVFTVNIIFPSFRLVYYLHPTDFELRKLAGIPQPKPKPKPKESENKRGKHRRKWEEPAEEENKTFNVPKNLDLQARLF